MAQQLKIGHYFIGMLDKIAFKQALPLVNYCLDGFPKQISAHCRNSAEFINNKPVILNSLNWSVFICFILLIDGCATKGPITGGPVDETPPQIIETYPEPRSLNVSRNVNVKLKFNENMNRGSVITSIFISPTLKQKPEFVWKGYKKLEIRFAEALEEEKTYVVTVGSNAMDSHKIRLDETYTLAFSTGNKIDNGTISGRIYGKYEIGKTLIFAYLMEESSNFSPDTLKPDYTTQLSNEGIFRFNYLSYGRYRLFGIEDNDNNRLFNSAKDRIAISPLPDIIISEEDTLSFTSFYKFSSVNTLNPRVLTIFPLDNSHLKFRALEPLVFPTSTDSIWISDSTRENKFYPTAIYPDAEDKNIVHLHFPEQSSEKDFNLFLGAFKDSSGNSVDSSSSLISFAFSASSDSIPPELLSVNNGSTSKFIYLQDRLKIIFSEAVSEESKDSSLTILNADNENVPYALDSVYPNVWEVYAEKGWASDETYSLYIDLEEVKDLSGNPAADSVWTMKFRTVNTDTFGIISGTILTDKEFDLPLYVSADKVGGRGRQVGAKVSAEGKFRLEELLPGEYLLNVFADRDRNGVYSPGSLAPYLNAELYFQSPDTVSVRSRWETSGHTIDFGQRILNEE